ncbi:YbaY family lipoprotein, partial [Leptolyngbya sp. FACHB-36]|uniref:YbaY family lipoprotein n=1 Tax=Leptolyngbya sp. FACHB-36 TaxID=2692808 RepID=UPI00168179E1
STAPRPTAVVTGTVFYLQRIALPPSAVVEVKLLDVSRPDAPAVTIAEQTLPTKGKQVPISFSLTYDPTKILPTHDYVVQARILVDGSPRWINTSRYAVITQGNPTQVDVRVDMVNSNNQPN